MDWLTALTHNLLPLLVWTSIQAVLLVGLLWLIGRFVPRLPATIRCSLWWLLGAQLILGLAWQTPISLPLLSPAPTTRVTMTTPATVTPTAPILHTATTTPARATTAHRDAHPQATTASTALPWRDMLVALWLAGLLAQLPIFARQWLRSRRIRRASRPLDDTRLEALCHRQTQGLPMHRRPQLRQSDAIASPQVMGLLHPVILLPTHGQLNADDQAMALAHELAHVQRGDLWFGWVPAVARWLFFFHPLVHVAVREYGLARETACDNRALRLPGANAQAYGQLLLKLGVTRPLTAGLAGASPTFGNLKRRLTMLQHASTSLPRIRDWLLVALIAVACVAPYRVVAAQSATQTTAPAPPAPPSAPLPPPPPPPPPALPPAPPVPPAPPLPPPAPDFGLHARNRSIDINSNATFGLALFDHDGLTIRGTQADFQASKHGPWLSSLDHSKTDADAIHKLKRKHAPFLWFRRDGKTYLTHDPATIAQAEKTLTPLNQLSRQQGELAGRQGEISGREAGLSARAAAVVQRLAALTQRQAALTNQQVGISAQKVALKQRQNDADTQAIERQLDTQRQSLHARQQDLARRQAQVQKRQAALKAKLDAQRQTLQQQRDKIKTQQQSVAKRQQQTAERVAQSMQKLMDTAVAKGVAKRIDKG